MLVRRYRAFIMAFSIMLALALTIVATLTTYKVKGNLRQMEYLTAAKSNEIIEAIYSLFYKAETLSALVIQGNGAIQDFERIAPVIINSPAIRNILLAPHGIVDRVYPLEGNQGVLGLNMLGPGDGNKEARLAKDTRKLTLGGPFVAVQGGEVLVGRLPVFLQKSGAREFWGLVSVTLNYPEALSPVRLRELDNLGFGCEIWRVNPDTGDKQIILRTSEKPLENPLEKEFSLLNARWKISISTLRPWYREMSFYVLLTAAILLSLLMGVIVQNYWDMREIRASLVHMAKYDALTGLPNRRAVFEKLESCIVECGKNKTSFMLAYIDINDFKLINDHYGHHMGDYVLKETAKRMEFALTQEQFVGRLGGDEFIVIFTGIDSDTMPAIVASLQESMNQPFTALPGNDRQVSLSVGVALFPRDGHSAEELTAHADGAMYASKERHRIRRRGLRKD